MGSPFWTALTLGVDPGVGRPPQDGFRRSQSIAGLTPPRAIGFSVAVMQGLRRHRLDGFLIALAVAEALGLALSSNAGRNVAAALASSAALLLLVRRRWPLVASLAALGLLAGSLVAAPKSPSVQFFGLMVTFAVLAATNSTRDGAIAWLVGVVLIGVGTGTADQGNALGDFLLTSAFCTVMWVAGWLISRHTRRADVMALRAQAAEHGQILALRDERARIARELHDVVSHGLSVVVLQTLAARIALEDGQAAEIDRHLDAVESTARDALTEMRRMLGLLQADDLDEPDPVAPSPGLRHVAALLERARDTGLDVDDTGVDPGVSLSSGLELTLYRVVQEALTNAAKHAPGACVQVMLYRDDCHVVVQVSDDGGTGGESHLGGAGHGLVGMRERVALYNGTLHAAPTPSGGFAVHVALPTDDQAPAAVVSS